MPTTIHGAGQAATMSSSKHTKIKERKLLADRITREGVEMPSCSRCEKRGLRCLASASSKRCNECVRSNSRNCDVSGPSASDWQSLQKEEDRLRLETRMTREAVATAMARLNRLEQQQDLLKTRGAEMLRRGLKTLDELEEVEERERQEAEAHVHLASPSITNSGGVAPEHDYLSALSPGFFDRWGVDGGTPPATLGS